MLSAVSMDDRCPDGSLLGGPKEPPGGPLQQPPARRERQREKEKKGTNKQKREN